MWNQRSGCSGFTLNELLVVLALVGLLLTLAVPAMQGLVNSIRLSMATQTFLSYLYQTRGEAIKRNSRVVLCKSDTGLRCVRTGAWDQGWIVFHDINNNAAVDTGETILQRGLALDGALRLAGNTHVDSYISFTPSGNTSTTSGAFQAGTLTVCRESANRAQARQIVISSGGRIRTQKTEIDSCA